MKTKSEVRFEDMPLMVQEIHSAMNTLLAYVTTSTEKQELNDDLLVIDEAAEFLRLSKATIYAMVSKRVIPHMKRGNRLYFSRKALLAWLQSNARKVYN